MCLVHKELVVPAHFHYYSHCSNEGENFFILKFKSYEPSGPMDARAYPSFHCIK